MWDTVRQWLHTLPVREEVVESVLMVMALLVCGRFAETVSAPPPALQH